MVWPPGVCHGGRPWRAGGRRRAAYRPPRRAGRAPARRAPGVRRACPARRLLMCARDQDTRNNGRRGAWRTPGRRTRRRRARRRRARRAPGRRPAARRQRGAPRGEAACPKPPPEALCQDAVRAESGARPAAPPSSASGRDRACARGAAQRRGAHRQRRHGVHGCLDNHQRDGLRRAQRGSAACPRRVPALATSALGDTSRVNAAASKPAPHGSA
jgi:hypothetical protein